MAALFFFSFRVAPRGSFLFLLVSETGFDRQNPAVPGISDVRLMLGEKGFKKTKTLYEGWDGKR